MEYSPFNRECQIETQHGLINYNHSMGTIYLTRRKREHIFKKYQAFNISESELLLCEKHNVYWIVIMYEKVEGGIIPYRIKMSKLALFEQYRGTDDDIQRIIPIRMMESKESGDWK